MQSIACVCLIAMVAVPLCGAATVGQTMSPVTRVVELLQGLAGQVEKDGKTEEALYEDFVCWGKSIINQKRDSNAAAASRIGELSTYIADLESGRIEMTSERTDLEKDIAELMSDMETATALRNKENEDFEMAKAEMKMAIGALENAIGTLGVATKDHKKGVLFEVRASLKGAAANGGMASLEERQASLKKAADLGERFLEKADATFLRRALLGQVPKVDVKKLNRKAVFKMSYKARSFKIQGVLEKMLQTFSINLEDAEATEDTALADYQRLTSSKDKQLEAAQSALNKMEAENGEAGMSKEKAKTDKKTLEAQVTNDEDFIKQTEQALVQKRQSWDERSTVRADELAAINKAISILSNDNSRDLFKKSFASQEQFLQVQMSSSARRSQSAGAALKEAALKSGDNRLLALARDLTKRTPFQGKFDTVLKAIESMISTLSDEEETDLQTKQTCESDRMQSTRAAIDTSRTIDEATEHIVKLTSEIDECNKRIAELNVEKAAADTAEKKAKAMRKEQNDVFLVTDLDDKHAAETVLRAQRALEEFYKPTFVQVSKQPVSDMADGTAPPPPPPTWDEGYSKKEGESMGIVFILQMVYEDIKKDRRDAQADEDASLADFKDFMKNSGMKLTDIREGLKDQMNALGDAMGKKESEESMRRDDKGGLDDMLKDIKAIDPNCEYYEVNYPLRRKNRQIEIDGLNKATAILQGATFDVGPDPNREIKPGDAAVLLQRNRA